MAADAEVVMLLLGLGAVLLAMNAATVLLLCVGIGAKVEAELRRERRRSWQRHKRSSFMFRVYEQIRNGL